MASPNATFGTADALAARGDLATATADPPPVVRRNPIDEVLLEEVAAALPEPLARHLRAAPDAARFREWLAAGAVYPLVADDPCAREAFLAEVAANPAVAARAVVRGLAAGMEPPDRGPAWWRLDRIGLALQAGTAAAFLAARAALFTLLVWVGGAAAFPDSAREVVARFVAADLPSGDPQFARFAPLLLVAAAAWLVLEAVAAPHAMEGVRQLPARLHGFPPPLARRTDAVYLLWISQATALAAILTGRAVWLAVSPEYRAAFPNVWWATLAVAVAVGGVLCRIVAGQFRSLARLGTAPRVDPSQPSA